VRDLLILDNLLGIERAKSMGMANQTPLLPP
jgi:hypothetical protein